ncbi:hypothetical protein GCM10008927_25380 [Amylibacter ulvae]|uniref:Uncharacterized protein n=1 Tax=Paramylibacter ulvae TaxID=1651968 RepID=A0ABQ3D6J5_9RHOB|nr:di-heme oxidoredictase family protein [Amylibacter ulvae]GHA58663.1 hypothetical protein GCM10008927_25380 [Amylibacter ulvae]
MKTVICSLILMLFGQQGVAQSDTAWAEKTPSIGAIENIPHGLQSKTQLEHLRTIGEALFTAQFTEKDGAGRPMATQAIIPTKPRRALRQTFARTSGLDANACSSCHNQPFDGGAGDFVANVFLSEGFNNHDFDTTDPEFSNERGTNHLFGSGLIELLAREMTVDLVSQRTRALSNARDTGSAVRVALITKDISFGHITATPDGMVDLSELDGVDTDLVIRPFSQKGVMTSLRQFTVNASNHHHGMQASERFGVRWTGEQDFDEDGYENEFSPADVSALVAWQASLPAPTVWQPSDGAWQDAAQIGAEHFDDFGCTSCHRTALPLNSLHFYDPGPVDAAGTLNQHDVAKPAIYDLSQLDWVKSLERNEQGQVMVPLFGDLKRHKITDPENELLGNELFSQRFVGRDIFMTAELWGLGSTAPYGHRNDFTTLDAIIRAHGGSAKSSKDSYENAPEKQRSEIVAFLKTLRIEVAE